MLVVETSTAIAMPLNSLRRDQRAQTLETIRGHQAPGGEFTQRVLQLRFEQASIRQQFFEEAGTKLP